MMMVGCDYDPQQQHSFQFGEVNLEIVNRFKYLGSVIHCNGSIDCNVEHQVVASSRSLEN